jgi:hypothetical protein
MTNLMTMMNAMETGNMEQVKEALQITSLSDALARTILTDDVSEVWDWMDNEGQSVLNAVQLEELERALEMVAVMNAEHFKYIMKEVG